mmetsp:Transcript_1768/g.1230  ORF Transcript_1768/g.1230 Transcript_1768/m.1230 type:complete len:117 (-) Transcript_1768:200-550(-)
MQAGPSMSSMCCNQLEMRTPLSDEEYLEKAFDVDANDFLAFFREHDPQVYGRYEELCRRSHNLDEFMANPAVFIVANNPVCCTKIAKLYIDRHCSDSRQAAPCSALGTEVPSPVDA